MAYIDRDIAADTPVHLSEATAGDFWALLKPRVMRLVVFTAFVGMMLAPAPLNPVTAAIAILCIAVGAGASGALNMWYDADIDAVMSRTRNRPIPSGAVAPGEALGFGLLLSALSVMTMGLLVNWASAAFLAFTIFFYAVVYSMWLKRSTPQNIVIGGAAGAFPPMIGWTAATGTISLDSALLFAIIFLWTPPHFWALALFKMRDYDNAHVPMLPNVAGIRATRNQILVYSIVLAVVAVGPAMVGMTSWVYGVLSCLLGLEFVRRAVAVWRTSGDDGTMGAEKRLFFYSIAYLAALFAVLLGEALWARFSGVIG